jgi:hypothetical protein
MCSAHDFRGGCRGSDNYHVSHKYSLVGGLRPPGLDLRRMWCFSPLMGVSYGQGVEDWKMTLEILIGDYAFPGAQNYI